MRTVTNRMLAAVWLVGMALIVVGLLLDRVGVVLLAAGFVMAAFASITYRLRRVRSFNERVAKRRNF